MSTGVGGAPGPWQGAETPKGHLGAPRVALRECRGCPRSAHGVTTRWIFGALEKTGKIDEHQALAASDHPSRLDRAGAADATRSGWSGKAPGGGEARVVMDGGTHEGLQ